MRIFGSKLSRLGGLASSATLEEHLRCWQWQSCCVSPATNTPDPSEPWPLSERRHLRRRLHRHFNSFASQIGGHDSYRFHCRGPANRLDPIRSFWPLRGSGPPFQRRALNRCWDACVGRHSCAAISKQLARNNVRLAPRRGRAQSARGASDPHVGCGTMAGVAAWLVAQGGLDTIPYASAKLCATPFSINPCPPE